MSFYPMILVSVLLFILFLKGIFVSFSRTLGSNFFFLFCINRRTSGILNCDNTTNSGARTVVSGMNPINSLPDYPLPDSALTQGSLGLIGCLNAWTSDLPNYCIII